MTSIKGLRAREVLDSRGNPTVEVDVVSSSGFGRAMVPSGASTGSHEAVELRDGGSRYMGKGVLKAVENVNIVIAKKLVGKEFSSQSELDEELLALDGTSNKSRLGANAVLGVSLAFARALASEEGVSLFKHLNPDSAVLPVPCFNVINGGKHAGLENDVQEQMLFPVGAKSFSEALRMGSETYHVLKKLLKKKLGASATHIADEGGFAPKELGLEDRLEIMVSAIEEAGYSKEIVLGLDCAASEFFSNNEYRIGDRVFDAASLASFYEELCSKYPIESIEDPFSEDDWEGFALLTEKIGDRIQVVGDDLLVTNVERIEKGIEEKAVNCLLLKVNQIGSLTESITAAKMAFDAGWGVMVSHRSGETEDAFISDLVVALETGQIKTGAPARSDRTAKYNQLLRIEEELGSKARYAGRSFKGPKTV